MRVVALVSGGKDSTYNMMQVVAEGHEIVALANLHPKDKDELDSYMYQTVGHQGIEKLAQAMDLPLYRKETDGNSVNKLRNYEPTDMDEVEDLYELLKQIQDEMQIEAVAVGAILSDYQRIRVENVCTRLGLVSLAYLWRRDQTELLQEMIYCQIHAIIIKVAALGLIPDRHLGKSLKDMQSHLVKMHEKYGLNVCGEGGEYETFTLDCPLFKSKIVIDENQIVVSSADPVCPVGYINFTKLRLVPKERNDKIDIIIVKNSLDFISDLDETNFTDINDPDLSETDIEQIEKETNVRLRSSSFSIGEVPMDILPRSNSITTKDVQKNPRFRLISRTESIDETDFEPPPSPVNFECEPCPMANVPNVAMNTKGWIWISGIQGVAENEKMSIENVMDTLDKLLTENSFTLRHICYITLYVKDIRKYSKINEVYAKNLNFQNPPTRVCVECLLPDNCHVILEAVAFNPNSYMSEMEHQRHTMHVQGISHWAPANIGTYSQSTMVGQIMYISGQIALVPGSMKIIDGGVKKQCKLALRHISRIAKAMNSQGQLRDVVQGICYVTHPSYIAEARHQWEKRSANAIMDYIVVPRLPRDAMCEWQVWAHTHNDKFDYEETGCSIGDFTVSIRRRSNGNYENNCAAVVCYVSTGLATSTTKLTECSNDFIQHHYQKAQKLTNENVNDLLKYILNKLLQDYEMKKDDCGSCSSSSGSSDSGSICTNSSHNHNNYPAVHLRVFYQVSAISSANFLIDSIQKFKDSPARTVNIAFTVIPVCNLQNFSTFISVCGLRHE